MLTDGINFQTYLQLRMPDGSARIPLSILGGSGMQRLQVPSGTLPKLRILAMHGPANNLWDAWHLASKAADSLLNKLNDRTADAEAEASVSDSIRGGRESLRW